MASELAEVNRVREPLSAKQTGCDVQPAYPVAEPGAPRRVDGHLLVSIHVPTSIAESR